MAFTERVRFKEKEVKCNEQVYPAKLSQILSHLKQEGNGRGRSDRPVRRLLCVKRSLEVCHHPWVRGQVGGDVAHHQLELHLAVASPEPNKATTASWGRRPLTFELVILSMAGHSRGRGGARQGCGG